MWVGQVDTNKDGVEERIYWKGRCIHKLSIFKCVYIGRSMVIPSRDLKCIERPGEVS